MSSDREEGAPVANPHECYVIYDGWGDHYVSTKPEDRGKGPIFYAPEDAQAYVDYLNDKKATPPSPSPDALLAAREALNFAVIVIAFIGRDRATDRLGKTLDGLVAEARKIEAIARAAIKEAGG